MIGDAFTADCRAAEQVAETVRWCSANRFTKITTSAFAARHVSATSGPYRRKAGRELDFGRP